jgi:hypothetical protein
MSAILDAALAYQAQGKVVVPTCWEDPCQIPAHNTDGPCQGKRSLVLWQDRDTVTPEEIRRWWTRWPAADVAILTGRDRGSSPSTSTGRRVRPP